MKTFLFIHIEREHRVKYDYSILSGFAFVFCKMNFKNAL